MAESTEDATVQFHKKVKKYYELRAELQDLIDNRAVKELNRLYDLKDTRTTVNAERL